MNYIENNLEKNQPQEFVDYEDVLSDDDTVDMPHILFEEIANNVKLEGVISEMIDRKLNNDISDFNLNNQTVIIHVHNDIYNICMHFVHSTLNYLRNMEFNTLNIDAISPQYYIVPFRLHEGITTIIDNAITNRVNTIRFDKMKNDIYNLVISFSQFIIEAEKDIFQDL